MHDIEALRHAVQRNCHISDAQHAREYTICVYLLKMREYFRWEKGYRQTEALPMAEIGGWVTERERLWDGLVPESFACLPLPAGCRDPFDAVAVNAQLSALGLIYSAGYGRFVKPHFFLGKLLRHERRDDFEVYVSSTELARDMTAPPAMYLDHCIYVRRDALRRLLWQRYEEWEWRKKPLDAMGRAVSHYPFDEDPERALDGMTDREVDTVILHEVGEGRAGEILGGLWADMVVAVACSRLEMQVRGVRDLLADCLVTLPELLTDGAEASLHFFFANFQGVRTVLAPGLIRAYGEWVEGGNRRALEQAVREGAEHWQGVAAWLRDTFGEAGALDDEQALAYLNSRRLA